jgi:hypothetical protein
MDRIVGIVASINRHTVNQLNAIESRPSCLRKSRREDQPLATARFKNSANFSPDMPAQR